MMRFKLLKAQCFEVYQNQPHHCQEEDEMARAGMLAIWLTRKRANDHHKAWRIFKTLYHSSWPYGLSSLLADQTFRSKTKKKTTTAKFGSHYACNPKCEKSFFLYVNSKFIILKKNGIF